MKKLTQYLNNTFMSKHIAKLIRFHSIVKNLLSKKIIIKTGNYLVSCRKLSP